MAFIYNIHFHYDTIPYYNGLFVSNKKNTLGSRRIVLYLSYSEEVYNETSFIEKISFTPPYKDVIRIPYVSLLKKQIGLFVRRIGDVT